MRVVGVILLLLIVGRFWVKVDVYVVLIVCMMGLVGVVCGVLEALVW